MLLLLAGVLLGVSVVYFVHAENSVTHERLAVQTVGAICLLASVFASGAPVDADESMSPEAEALKTRVHRVVPKGSKSIEYVVVRGTVLARRLITRECAEPSGGTSVQTYAEIEIDMGSATYFGDERDEESSIVLIDRSPFYYHPRTGEAVQREWCAMRLAADGSTYEVDLFPHVCASLGDEIIAIAVRSRDGQHGPLWHPCFGSLFAVTTAVVDRDSQGFVELVGHGELDSNYVFGDPGTLVPLDAWTPEVLRIPVGAEEIEAAFLAAVTDAAQ